MKSFFKLVGIIALNTLIFCIVEAQSNDLVDYYGIWFSPKGTENIHKVDWDTTFRITENEFMLDDSDGDFMYGNNVQWVKIDDNNIYTDYSQSGYKITFTEINSDNYSSTEYYLYLHKTNNRRMLVEVLMYDGDKRSHYCEKE